MKKAFQQTALILMRELSWRCFGHKIDRRRLFLLSAILTVSGVLFQILVHSYVIPPPTKQFRAPHETDSSSYRASNSNIRSNEFLKGTIYLSLPNSVILPNSTNKFVKSVSVEQDSAEARARRKSLVSGSIKDKNLADTAKITVSSFPHGHVSSGKQVEVDEILNLYISF